MNVLYLEDVQSPNEGEMLLSVSDDTNDSIGVVNLTKMLYELAKIPASELQATLLREITTQTEVNLAEYDEVHIDFHLGATPQAANLALHNVLTHLAHAGTVDRQTVVLSV